MDNMIGTEDLAFTKVRIVKKRFWGERKAERKPGIQLAWAEEDAPVFTLCELSHYDTNPVNGQQYVTQYFSWILSEKVSHLCSLIRP